MGFPLRRSWFGKYLQGSPTGTFLAFSERCPTPEEFQLPAQLHLSENWHHGHEGDWGIMFLPVFPKQQLQTRQWASPLSYG